MNYHRYQANGNRIKISIVILRRNGVQTFLRTLIISSTYRFRYLFSPLILAFKFEENFWLQGKQFSYFYHKHNATWTNERCIEIPIVLSYIKEYRPSPILEVGAVLYHYSPQFDLTVVDKFEQGKDITNKDAVSYQPDVKFDLIISISTLEHAGFDDDVVDPGKIEAVMNNLKTICLQPGGAIVATMPLGYNPWADSAVMSNTLGLDEIHFMKRISKDNRWSEVEKTAAKKIEYSTLYPGANAIVVGVLHKY